MGEVNYCYLLAVLRRDLLKLVEKGVLDELFDVLRTDAVVL